MNDVFVYYFCVCLHYTSSLCNSTTKPTSQSSKEQAVSLFAVQKLLRLNNLDLERSAAGRPDQQRNLGICQTGFKQYLAHLEQQRQNAP